MIIFQLKKYMDIKFLIVAFIFNVLNVYGAPNNITCPAGCRLSNGKLYDVGLREVERAGVLILIPLCERSSTSFSDWGIVVGHDKNINIWMLGQAGKLDVDDVSAAHGAARELEEETGGCIIKQVSEIGKLPYLCTSKKQFFVLRGDYSWLSKIQRSVKKAQKSKLPRCYKEIDEIEVVTVQELLKLGARLQSVQTPVKPQDYQVQTTCGRMIVLQSHYAHVFGSFYQKNNLENAIRLFKSLCVKRS